MKEWSYFNSITNRIRYLCMLYNQGFGRVFSFHAMPAEQAEEHGRMLFNYNNLVWSDGTCFLPRPGFYGSAVAAAALKSSWMDYWDPRITAGTSWLWDNRLEFSKEGIISLMWSSTCFGPIVLLVLHCHMSSLLMSLLVLKWQDTVCNDHIIPPSSSRFVAVWASNLAKSSKFSAIMDVTWVSILICILFFYMSFFFFLGGEGKKCPINIV